MKITNYILIIVSIILLHGCGSEPEPEAKDKKKEPPTVILDPAIKTLNKAKTLEQKLLDAEAERKKKMDEQEAEDKNSGGDSR